MNRLLWLAMVEPAALAGVLSPDTRAMVEEMAAIIRPVELPPGRPSEQAFQVVHPSGKRCGHTHRDQAKAEACRARLGDGWAVAVK